MKAFAQPRSGSFSTSESLTPSSHKQRPPRVPKENVEPNAMPPESSIFRSPPLSVKSPSMRSWSPLPSRPPPSSAPLKRKLTLETPPGNVFPLPSLCDSGVQVILRMKPLKKDEDDDGSQIVKKISANSISIFHHTFTFDSVADTGSTQNDIFQLVGVPLVENCLSGFNSSIFAYGQTGSGKTYTMWGPSSALIDNSSLNQERGLTPRVFEMLFSRIHEEQSKLSDKKIIYECHCSFLEIYNEQITDLLAPMQKNLQIREDVRTGVYVDCLTEEYVCQVKDVIQLLIKGLSNRKTGATSINLESSRSHCVFTCVVKCRSKSMSDGPNSLRTSRINLVDLAGSERQKSTRAAGERLKEAGNINRSLSQLGNLINILAEVSQSGKHRHVPYRDSKLTFLLQESLGGNAKLAMVCTVSPSDRCRCETFSTLRFAQRAKAIKNQAVINETTEDNVQFLREQIRQLKDELVRIKSDGPHSETNSKTTGWNVQRSLNLLRLSLCCPRALPDMDDDGDEEMEIVKEGTESIYIDAHSNSNVEKASANEELSSSRDLKDQTADISDTEAMSMQLHGSVSEKDSGIPQDDVVACEIAQTTSDECRTGSRCQDIAYDVFPVILNTKENICHNESESVKIFTMWKSLNSSCTVIAEESSAVVGSGPAGSKVQDQSYKYSTSRSHFSPCSVGIVACESSFALTSPKLSISPRLENCRSLRTSSFMSSSQKNTSSQLEGDPEVISVSFAHNFKHSDNNAHPNKNPFATTEHLVTSLHQGLQIINCHQISSLRNSSFMFRLNKIDVGIQTHPQESSSEDSFVSICSYCNNKAPPSECHKRMQDAGLQIVPVDDCQSASKSQLIDRCKKLVPKAVEKVLAGAIRREMALEDHCAKQAAEIMHLSRLVQQYKHERECMSIIEQTREDKISRLEGLMDGVIPTEEFMEDEFLYLRNEHMILKEKFDNHPEILRLKIELKRVQSELDEYINFFDLGERDVLIEEIQDLRCQLQYFMDHSSASSCTQNLCLQLTQSTEPISTLTTLAKTLTTVAETKEENANELLVLERRREAVRESKLISFAEEVRAELKTCRSLAEKWRMEFESEKKCTEELKEALQTALEGHSRILEQYADLEEKHMILLGRHRKMREGITEVKIAAIQAGVKGAEHKFIESLAAQIEALRAERENERHYWRDENKGLLTQLRDTAEAVEAAGELLIRLKEAEVVVATLHEQVLAANERADAAYQEIADLKKNYERQIATLTQLAEESRSLKEARFDNSAETSLYSWFYNYDRCNI